MTKKHFTALANMLRDRMGHNYSTIEFDNGYNTAIAHIASDMADYFAEENPNFDRDRFLTACGVV